MAAGAVIGAFVLIAGLAAAGVFDIGGTTELDVQQAEIGVQQVLTDPINGYGRTDLGTVVCNNGQNPVVKKGDGFTCVVAVAGDQRQVSVVFTDDAGTYEVDRPR